MKISIFLLLLSLIGINQTFGQEKKHSLILSGILAHYSNVGFTPNYLKGYNFYPINPGLEAIYMYSVTPNLNFGSGINFQSGSNMSWKRDLLRFHFNAVSILLQARIDLFQFFNKSMRWFFTSGFYIGKSFDIIGEDTDSGGFWNNRDLSSSSIENYSEDNVFTDLYFDLGFTQRIGRLGEISFAPFMKNRQNKTWMEYHQKNLHYGIKISYPLKF